MSSSTPRSHNESKSAAKTNAVKNINPAELGPSNSTRSLSWKVPEIISPITPRRNSMSDNQCDDKDMRVVSLQDDNTWNEYEHRESFLVQKKISTFRSTRLDFRQTTRRQIVYDKYIEYDDIISRSTAMSLQHYLRSFIHIHGMELFIFIMSILCTILFYCIPYFSRQRWKNVSAWAWPLLIAIISKTFMVATFIEYVLKFLIVPWLAWMPWFLRMSFEASLGATKQILFFGALHLFVIDGWIALDSDEDKRAEITSSFNSFSWLLLTAYIVLIAKVFRVIFENMAFYRLIIGTFERTLKNTLFIDDVLKKLCCSNEEQRKKLNEQFERDESRAHFMDRLEHFRGHVLSLPLERSTKENAKQYHSDLNQRWQFTELQFVEVTTKREMAALATVLYENMLDIDGNREVTMQDWKKFFQSSHEANRAFRLLFVLGKNAISKTFSLDDFSAAVLRHFKHRNQLMERLNKFASVYSLLQAVFGLVFYVIVAAIIAILLDFNFHQLVISLSAIMISLSFALGNSLKSFVESVVFVFVSKNFETNDIVIINDIKYSVQNIALLQTELKTFENQVTFIPNQYLASLPIVNLTRSPRAVIALNFDVAMGIDVKTLNSLRSQILKFTIHHSNSWNRKCSLSLGDSKKKDCVELGIRVESAFRWQQTHAFSTAEFELRNLIRTQLTKWGATPILPFSATHTIE